LSRLEVEGSDQKRGKICSIYHCPHIRLGMAHLILFKELPCNHNEFTWVHAIYQPGSRYTKTLILSSLVRMGSVIASESTPHVLIHCSEGIGLAETTVIWNRGLGYASVSRKTSRPLTLSNPNDGRRRFILIIESRIGSIISGWRVSSLATSSGKDKGYSLILVDAPFLPMPIPLD